MEVEFTVANCETDSAEQAVGQSFTPNIQGPDGTGTPGSGTVNIRSFIVGYPNYSLGERCMQVYLYDTPLEDPSDVGQAQGLVAWSDNIVDEVNTKFGPSSFSRTFTFDPVSCKPLNVNATYYVYFSEPQIVSITSTSDYDGGSFYDYDGDPDPDLTVQFIAALYYSA